MTWLLRQWKTNVPDVETVEKMYPVQNLDQQSQYSSDLSSNASDRDSADEEEISEPHPVSL